VVATSSISFRLVSMAVEEAQYDSTRPRTCRSLSRTGSHGRSPPDSPAWSDAAWRAATTLSRGLSTVSETASS
jgi:hypothetical protein